MAGPHENLEHAEHAQHAAHGGGENNKKIALIISVLALCLAFSETFGKSAQTAALNFQIEASNLWNFFQAKNIRRTLTIVATEIAKIEATTRRKSRARLRSTSRSTTGPRPQRAISPSRRLPAARAKARASSRGAHWRPRKMRDLQLNKYHNFEFASAAFQIGIVLASAAVITSMIGLAYAAICVGMLGMVLTGTGLFVPDLLHNILHWFEALFAGGEPH